MVDQEEKKEINFLNFEVFVKKMAKIRESRLIFRVFSLPV